jgi:hypothetical protein
MISRPDRIEAQLLDAPDHRRQLGPADGTLDLRELDADLEGTAPP